MPHSTRKPAAGRGRVGRGRAAAEHGQTEPLRPGSRCMAAMLGYRAPVAFGDVGAVGCPTAVTMPRMLGGPTGPRVTGRHPVLRRACDPDALERLASSMRSRRFRRGEVIFHLGDPGDALFVIVSGEVKISLPSETGDEAILATLRPGDVFGELALLDGAPRSASATALTADRDRHPAARPLPRADRHRGGRSRRAARVDRRRAAAAHDRTSRSCTSSTSPGGSRPASSASPRRAGRRPADGAIRLRTNLTQARPGGDGRLHAPEREQAARPVHRRRPDPAGARRHRRDRPRRAGRGRPPLTAAQPPRPASGSSRRTANSTPAVVSAARVRPWLPAEERRPRLAMLGRRGSRRRPSRPCPRPARAHGPPARPSAPARSRMRRARSRSGSSARSPRRRGRQCGAGACVREREPSTSPNSAPTCAARADLARGRAASRVRQGARRSPRTRSVSPSPRRGRPRRSVTIAAASSTSVRRSARPGRVVAADCADPHVDGLGPGVGRDLRVRRRAAAPRRGSRRPATRRCPSAGTSGPRRRRRGRRARRRGQRVVVPHRAHLARRTGQGDGDPPVGARRRTSPAPCRSGSAAPRPTGSARPA